MSDTMDLLDDINELILLHTGEGCSPDDVISAVEMVLDGLRDHAAEDEA